MRIMVMLQPEVQTAPGKSWVCNVHVFASPLGKIFAAVEHDGTLLKLEFIGSRRLEDFIERLQLIGYWVVWNARALREVVIQVAEYFARKRHQFDMKVRLSGTHFQRMVWNQLAKIPFGQTVTYGELAILVGKPGAYRAVGRANGANPVSLVIPCHRVVGADRELCGYGAGVDVKRGLLALEGALPWSRQFLPGISMSSNPRARDSRPSCKNRKGHHELYCD